MSIISCSPDSTSTQSQKERHPRSPLVITARSSIPYTGAQPLHGMLFLKRQVHVQSFFNTNSESFARNAYGPYLCRWIHRRVAGRTPGSGTGQPDTALAVLNQFPTLEDIARTSNAELEDIASIGKSSAARIRAELELGRRLVSTMPHERPSITSPADTANYEPTPFWPRHEQVASDVTVEGRRC